MSDVLKCPKCDHRKFSVIAHVAEEWIVDQHGEFIAEGDPSFRETTHRPYVGGDQYHFTCAECGTTAITEPQETP